MRKTEKFSDNTVVITLAEAKQPVFTEVKYKPWITYGEEDDYPKYLLRLFNNSAKHNAIITNKVKYVMGKGFGISDTAVADVHKNSNAYKFINSINANGEDIDEVASKAEMDLEIYGGFYLEVIWSRAKQIASISHVDYTKYRSNYDNTTFYYKKDGDFTSTKKADNEFPAFNPLKPTGKQILYYKDYRPGINTYTLPGYIGALNYIEADVEVGKHTYTNALCGFMPSKLINLNNGEPTDEQKRTIEKRFTNKFSGTDGKKFILAFNQDKDKAPTVVDLGASDLSKEDFTAVDNLIQSNIYAGHQITSPILFGIKEAGQLGGRNEMREAYEIFQNIYVNGQQQKIESVFNWLASFSGVTDDLEIIRTEPVGFEFGEEIIAQNLTQTEIREKIGAEPLEDNGDEQMQEALEKLRLLPQRVGEVVVTVLTKNELRAMIGRPPVTDGTGDQPPSLPAQPQTNPDGSPTNPTPQKMSEALESINDLGADKESFVIVKSKPVKFSSDKEMIDSEIELWQNFAEIELPKIKRGGKSGPPTAKEISVKYSYEVRPDAPPLIGESRPFCKKLMELDRLYTRQDIETMSARLGYSVWSRRGGWYHNPETDKTTPYCRHQWSRHLVIRKQDAA